MYADRLIKTTAKKPHKPTTGVKKVTKIMIAANTLFNEKNIKL